MKTGFNNLALFVAGFAACLISFVVIQPARYDGNRQLPGRETADDRISAGEVSWEYHKDDPLLDRRVIVISSEINDKTAKEVIYKLLFLEATNPADDIDLFLNTSGGYINDALAIVDTIESIQAPVNTCALGSCESAAAMILASGTGVRSAGSSAIIMIHFVELDASHRAYDFSTVHRGRLLAFWKRAAALPDDWLASIDGNSSYYLSPVMALEHKGIDERLTRSKPEK